MRADVAADARAAVAVKESKATVSISPLPTSQFGRAVERFNRYALRFTQPGPSWLVTSVKLGFAMKALGIVVGTAVAVAASALGYNTQVSSPNRGALELAFLGLVLAPLIETAQIWLVHALIRRWLGLTGFVSVSTLLAYAGHYTPDSIPISAALAFCVMSYQYVSFRGDIGAGRAFAGVAVSHAAYNSIAALIITIESVSGKKIM